jgi:hypothetical protein
MNQPSVRSFKETSPGMPEEGPNQEQVVLLADILASKDVNPAVALALSQRNVIGGLLDGHFLGNLGQDHGNWRYRKAAAGHLTEMAIAAAEVAISLDGSYTGTTGENTSITEGHYHSAASHGPGKPDHDYDSRLRDFRRNGAARRFRSGLVEIDSADAHLGSSHTPIAVIGGGPGGVVSARTLRNAGFKNITLFDNTGMVGGIWNRRHVHQGSKNNPFTIRYDGISMRPPNRHSVQRYDPERSDGILYSGQDVRTFVSRLSSGISHNEALLRIQQGNITEIEPGDLDHVVRMKVEGEDRTERYPIVIYAPGNGEPLPLSREGYMRTDTARAEAGRRWQKHLGEEELRELASQKLVFMGLGNSTAEMLYQLQAFEDREGIDIDYTVLTHRSDTALQTPLEAVDGGEPVFRDLSKPNLTRLAGDLPHIEALYWKAMIKGKIWGGVSEWQREGDTCRVTRNGETIDLPVDRMYSLIGYRQNPDNLRDKGIHVLDEYLGTGAFDFDGEVQKSPGATGRDRLYPGYFVIGSAMKSPHNPNAMVIPGIQYQANDLLTTVALRAAEFALRDPAAIAASKRIWQAAQRKYAFGVARAVMKNLPNGGHYGGMPDRY